MHLKGFRWQTKTSWINQKQSSINPPWSWSRRWVAFEQKGFLGEQFVLEKGEYPRWSTWTNSQSSYCLLSIRPLRVVRERHTLLKDLLCHDPLSLVLRSITGQRRTQTTSVRELQLCREEDGNRGWWHSQLVGSRLPGPCGQCQSCQRDVSLRWLSCCCYQTPLTHEPGLDHCFSPQFSWLHTVCMFKVKVRVYFLNTSGLVLGSSERKQFEVNK